MNASKAKHRIFEILESATHGDKPSRAFGVFIVTLIAVNVLAVVLETVGALGLLLRLWDLPTRCVVNAFSVHFGGCI